ncbi:MAG: peptidoglycan DD-metalloendopeptidase family protein [Bacteroidota bacterium]
MKKLAGILLFFLALGVAHPGWAQSKKQQELESRRQALLEEIKEINNLLFKTRGEKKSVLAQVEDLDQRIAARENLIRVTNQQANLLTREINSNLATIDQLRTELTSLREDYAAMINKSYKSKSDQSRIMFLFSSENFLQAYKRMQYMKQYTQHRKKQGEAIKAKTAELQVLNESLLQQKKDKDALIAENRLAKKKLDEEKRDQEALVASLKKDEGKFAKQIRGKQKEADRIERQIDKLIREAIAANNKETRSTVKTTRKSTSTFTLTPEAKTLAKNFRDNKGKLSWPVERGRILNRYGTRQHPQFPNVKQKFNGVEIITETGMKVRSIFKGEVFQVQQTQATNKWVYVRHGDYITIYTNLVDLKVKKGDKVSTKQELGTVFTNPQSGRAVMKFYVYQNTKKMNPADWVYRM